MDAQPWARDTTYPSLVQQYTLSTSPKYLNIHAKGLLMTLRKGTVQQVRKAFLSPGWYQSLITARRVHAFERAMITLGIWGFVLHLGLIMLGTVVAPLRVLVGTNMLAALYTPFSFVLFYEVLLLLLAIPQSTTRALALQFQIISLIILRNAFKDLAVLPSLGEVATSTPALLRLLSDMLGGLTLFALMAVFTRVSMRSSVYEESLRTPSLARDRFIAQKQGITVGLTAIFFAVAAWSFSLWAVDLWNAFSLGTAMPQSPTKPFYEQIFTALIFADVLILLLSLHLSDSYELVMRNAGFVVATVLLRVSLAAPRPLDAVIAVGAVTFALLILLVYKWWPHTAEANSAV